MNSQEFTLVMRGQSVPIFEPNESLVVNVEVSGKPALVTFRTRHLNKGLNIPFPGDLWVEARGYAQSIEDAVKTLSGAIGNIVPILAISVNGSISDLETEIVYESTSGLIRRDFLQSFIPDEKPVIHMRRSIDGRAISELIEKLCIQKDLKRIIQAISQYNLALEHWRFGRELLTTAHLYIAMETLTKVVLRKALEANCQTEEDFAKTLGIDPKKLGKCERLSTVLDAAVRREILFRKDIECYKKAKKASDGFEHGFVPFDEAREIAREARDKTATYFREAIIALLNISEDSKTTLLSEKFAKPLGYWPAVKYVRGKLISAENNLASVGNLYPVLEMKSTIKSLSKEDNGRYQVKLDETVTPQIANGVQFLPESYEVWAP
jgi:hypothetical protein